MVRYVCEGRGRGLGSKKMIVAQVQGRYGVGGREVPLRYTMREQWEAVAIDTVPIQAS